MSAVMTPPAVLIPRERGATLRRKKVLSLLRGAGGEDGGLDDHTIGNSLIRVDALVGLLAVEEVGNFLTKRQIRVEPPTKTVSRTFDLSI